MIMTLTGIIIMIEWCSLVITMMMLMTALAMSVLFLPLNISCRLYLSCPCQTKWLWWWLLCTTEFLWQTFKHSSFLRKISLSLSKLFYIGSQLFCNVYPFFIICKVIIIDSTQYVNSRKSPEIWHIALHYWVLMGRHLGGKNSLSEFISFGSNSLCKKTFSSCDW